MSKAIVGAAELAGAAVLMFVPGLNVISSVYLTSLMFSLAASGVSMEAGAIASALTSNRGTNITTRQAAALRQIIYGQQRVGGVTVYRSTTGTNGSGGNFVLNDIIPFATHSCNAFVNLYLDGRQVFWKQTRNPQGHHANVGCGTVSNPPTASITISSGTITAISATGGSGFANVKPVDGYRVKITDTGGGSGAVGWAYNSGSVASPVWSVTMSSGGANYTSATQADIQGAYTFGGTGAADQQDPSQSGYGLGYGIAPGGAHYNFSGKVYCEPRFGDQVAGDVMSSLTANDSTWGASSSGIPQMLDCAYLYINVGYDATLFSNEPEIRVTMNGKDNILDPRSGHIGYSTNWALQVADVITDTTWGLGDNTVNQAQLITAANQCDIPLATSQGTTPTYQQHIHYDTSTAPGDAISMMMESAAGKISRIGGEWFIWPGVWKAPTLTFDESSLIADVSWEPKRSFRDLINCVNGTYTAPNYPYGCVGNLYDKNGWYYGTTNNLWNYAWQPTNFPQYACDSLHGFGSNIYLSADNGVVLPKELALRGVIDIVQAQRLAKIELLRNRNQGTAVFHMSLSAWQLQPMDTFYFNFPQMGWTTKCFEVDKVQLICAEAKGEGEGTGYSLSVDVTAHETDASIYEWSEAEELSPYDVQTCPDSSGTPAVPTNVTLENDSTTALMNSDGTTMSRLLVKWTEPDDVYINEGGTVQIQYAGLTVAGSSTSVPVTGITPIVINGVVLVAQSAWIDAGSVQGNANYFYIDGVSQFTAVTVQVRGVRSNGAASAWVQDYLGAANIPVIVNTPTSLLSIIAGVNVLTPADKVSVIADINSIGVAYSNNMASAQVVAVSTAAYTTAYNTFTAYLATLTTPVAWNSMSGYTTINSATFTAYLQALYTAQAALLVAIANAANTSITQINSASYLTNSDKIALIQTWNSELLMQSTIDGQAASSGVSHTAYDSTISTFSSALVSAGAPSNWATLWPDGTTSGPWPNVQVTLATQWANIASARVALQNAISSALASSAQANAFAAAVASAATDATTKMQTAVNLVPANVSILPTLPSASYPAGKLVMLTSNSQLYTVNTAGTAWVSPTVATSNISGVLPLSQTSSAVTSALSNAFFQGTWWNGAYPVGGGVLAATPVALTSDVIINYSDSVYSYPNMIPAPSGVNASGIYVRWTGYVTVGSAGTYTFGVSSDDGANLYVNGTQLVNNLSAGQAAGGSLAYTQSGTIALAAGQTVPIILEYQNTGGQGCIQFLMTPPSGIIQLVTAGTACITSASIAAGTITASQISAGTITGNNIVAGTITGKNIAGNTITGNNLVAGTITANQIAAGAIGANQIAANSITTAALTVCDWTNLCYNPSFEDGSAQWVLGNGASISPSYAHTGTNSLKLPNGSGTYAVTNGNRLPVQPGETYLFQAWAYLPNTITSGQFYIRLQGVNSAGGYDAWDPTTNILSVGSVTGAWTLLTCTATVPAGIVSLDFQPTNISVVGTDIYVDDCVFRRCADASLIVDGSITATKIAAGAITADMITTGTLNASSVAVTNLNANNITTGTLNASSVAVTNLNANNITTGTLSAHKVVFDDGSALTTASRVKVSTASPSTTSSPNTGTKTALGNFVWNVSSASTSDVYNIVGSLNFTNSTATINYGAITFYVYVDGVSVFSGPSYFNLAASTTAGGSIPIAASFSGLSATTGTNTHTVQIYVSTTGYYAINIMNNSYAICERIY